MTTEVVVQAEGSADPREVIDKILASTGLGHLPRTARTDVTPRSCALISGRQPFCPDGNEE